MSILKDGAIDTSNPPWLYYAGLPSDGSVDGGIELEAFGRFMSPTAEEQAGRQAIRYLIQHTVHTHINAEATTKIVGLCAVGIDCYSSTLEFEVDAPGEPLDRVRCLTKLGEILKFSGFRDPSVTTPFRDSNNNNNNNNSSNATTPSTPSTAPSPSPSTCPTPRGPTAPADDTSSSLLTALLAEHKDSSVAAPYLLITAPINDARVKIAISGTETAEEKKRRYHTKRVVKVLNQFEGTATVVRIVLCILERMKLINPENGLLTTDTAAVLCLAFLLSRWSSRAYAQANGNTGIDSVGFKAERPSGHLLKDFFNYYSTFDFEKTCIVLPDAGEIIDFFPQKPTPSKQMCVYPSSKSRYNLACLTTKLGPVVATLKYVTLAIGKWDLSPSVNRGKSLLFNIIAHRDLWSRYYKLLGLPVPESVGPRRPLKHAEDTTAQPAVAPAAAAGGNKQVQACSSSSSSSAAAVLDKTASDDVDEVDANDLGEA